MPCGTVAKTLIPRCIVPMPDVRPLHLVSGRSVACDECRLRQACFPDHLNDEITQAIATVVRPRPPVPRGSYLFRQGTPVTAFYFMRSGSAKSVLTDDSGRESIMSFLFPTDLIGTASMDLTRYHDSVVTLERSSFCELRVSDIEPLFHDDPPALMNFFAKVSSRIATERHARVRLEHSSADERVADFILELSGGFARLGRDPHLIQLTMSRYDIANYIGLAPETVSRVLRRFHDNGLIDVHHKQLLVRAPQLLRNVAANGRDAVHD